MQKIGVFAGAFDPVHKGHSEFVAEVIAKYHLDKVFVLVEKNSRHKKLIAGYAHRKKMAGLAFSGAPKVQIYAHNFNYYPISNFLPRLKVENPRAKIYLLIGEDVAGHISSWRGAKHLLDGVEIIVAERNIPKSSSRISSLKIRNEIKAGRQTNGLDGKVLKYIKEHGLYTNSGE